MLLLRVQRSTGDQPNWAWLYGDAAAAVGSSACIQTPTESNCLPAASTTQPITVVALCCCNVHHLPQNPILSQLAKSDQGSVKKSIILAFA